MFENASVVIPESVQVNIFLDSLADCISFMFEDASVVIPVYKCKVIYF